MWAFFAIACRFLWSGCNAIDQILSRVHQREKVMAGIIVELCTYLPYTAIACWLSGSVYWSAPLFLWTAVAMVCLMLTWIPYFKALQREEAYNVIPFYEMTPVFLTILALVFRHEYLTFLQVMGGAFIILSGFVFSWDFENSRIKKGILTMMCFSAFMAGAQQFCIKEASTMADTWTVTFYYTAGEVMMGFLLFGIFGRARKEIIRVCRETSGGTVFLGVAQGGLSFIGLACLTYAFKVAPTTGHVAALSGTQPFFSFLMAWVLGYLAPKHFKKLVFDKETKLKMLLLLGIFVGIYLLMRPGV